MARAGRVAGAVAAGAVAAGAAAGAVAVERADRARRALPGLDPDGGYDVVPDEVLTVVARDGVRLHVEIDHPADSTRTAKGSGRHTPASGLTFVLSHGFTLSSKCWVFQRRALVAAGHRVVVWDQRSHGQSSRSDAEHTTIEQLGHDLHDVIETVAPEGDLVLVGHSMGGMSVMSLAHHHPEIIRERVRAVALIATSAGGGGLTNLGLGPWVGVIVGRLGPRVLDRLADLTGLVGRARRIGRRVEDAMVEKYSYDSPVSHELVRFTGEMIMSTPFDVMSDFLGAIEALDERDHLGAFAGVECLVVNGRGDLLTPPEHSEDIVARIPGCEHVLVEDAGHLVMLEHPDLVNQQLLMVAERGVNAQAENVAVQRKPRVRRTITDLKRRRQVTRAKRAKGAKGADGAKRVSAGGAA